MKKDKSLKNFHKNIFKMMNFKSGMLSMFQNVGSLVGFSNEKKKKKDEKSSNFNNISNLDDKKFESNPIIKGLFQMLHSLKSLEIDSLHDQTIDIQVKLKILALLSYFNDIRQSSLISLFVQWFTEHCDKYLEEKNKLKSETEELVQKEYHKLIETNSNFKEKLPEIFLTGIEEIDENSEDNIFADFFKMSKRMGRKLKENLSQKSDKPIVEIIPDLNAFFTPAHLMPKKVSILPSLLLLFYRNKSPEVEKKVLRLITKLYNQREELVHNLMTLEMIFDDNEAKLYAFLQEKIYILRILVEKSELWMSRFALNPLKPKETDVKTIKEIINLLKNLNLYLFSDTTIDEFDKTNLSFSLDLSMRIREKVIISNKNDNKISNFHIEEDIHLTIFKERQNLMQFSEGHIPIINLIRDCLHQFANIALDNDPNKNEAKKMLIEMFSMAFITLRHFCLHNHKNQLILYEYLYTFQEYLQYDLKQIHLICAIFSENKLLLEKIDSGLIKCFLNLIENEGRKTIFLEFFSVMQQCRGDYLLDNQNLVVNSFLPQKKFTEKEHKILYSLPSSSKIRFYFDDIFDPASDKKDLFSKLEEANFQDTYRDEGFLYQASLIDILIMTTKGSNVMNIALNKLKKSFEVSYLIDILTLEDGFIAKKDDKSIGLAFLKPKILDFLNEVHFLVKSSDFLLYKRQVKRLVEFEAKRIISLKRNILIYQKTEFLQYFFVDILSFLLRIYDNYVKGIEINKLDIEEMEEYTILLQLNQSLLKTHELWQDLLEQGGMYMDNLNKFHDVFNSDLYSSLTPIKSSEENTPVSNKKQEEQEEEEEKGGEVKFEANNEEFVKKQEKSQQFTINQIIWLFFEKLQISSVNTIYVQKYTNNNKFIIDTIDYGPQKVNVDESPMVKNIKNAYVELNKENLWFFFKNGLNNCRSLHKELEMEKKVLSKAFLKLDKVIEKEEKKEKSKKNAPKVKEKEEKPSEDSEFNLEIFLKKIIDFIQYGFKDPENKDTILILLKVLKQMIDANDIKETPQVLFQIQELFRKLETSKMIVAILVSKKLDSDLLIKLLSFASSLLKRGNKNIQREFLSLFKSTHESEFLFMKFHNFLRKEVDSIESIVRNSEIQRLQGEAHGVKRKKITTKEIYLEIFELSKNKEGLVLKKLLVFLRNLAEGHNIEMQQYLSKQTHSRNSYDLVSDVIDLLVTYYFNSCCNALFKNISLCLDAINGLVQGPCAENQTIVLDSPFMEFVKDVFYIDEDIIQNNVRNDTIRRISRKMSKNPLESKENISNSESNANKAGLSPDSRTMSESPSPAKRNPREKTFIFNEESEKKIRPLSESQIARLEYKIMMVVLGLLEMRNLKESDLVMKKIIQALPIETLEDHMLRIYKNFRKTHSKQYVMAAFGNVSYFLGFFQISKILYIFSVFRFFVKIKDI